MFIYLFILVYIGFVWFIGIANKVYDVLAPFWAFVFLNFLFFVLRPISILGGYSNPFNLTNGDIFRGILVGVIGLIGFFCGYFNKYNNIVYKFPKLLPVSSTFWLGFLLIIYYFLGILGIIFIIKNLGIQNILYGSILVAYYLKRGGGIITLLFRFSYIGLIVNIAFVLFNKRKTQNLRFKLLLILGFIINLLISLIIGVRGFLGQVLLSIFLLYFYSKNTNALTFRKIFSFRYILLLLFIIIAGYFIAVPFNIFRHYGFIDFEKSTSFEFIWNQVQAFLIPFDWFCYVSKLSGPLLFRHYVYYLLAFIPRDLWGDKPITSVLYYLTEEYLGDPLYNPTYTLTIPGEFYIQLSLVGVFLGMFFVGFFIKSFYKYRLIHDKNYLVNALYIFTFVSFIRGYYTSFQTWFLEGLIINYMLTIPFLGFFKTYKLRGGYNLTW